MNESYRGGNGPGLGVARADTLVAHGKRGERREAK